MMPRECLKKRWDTRFYHVADKGCLEDAFVFLADCYQQKHRYYHTLQHIDHCLQLFDACIARISDAATVEVALWFHDVIYDPKGQNNESLSAQHARCFLAALAYEKEKITKVEHFIMLTQHPSVAKTDDEKLMIDIDLAILGSDDSIYDRYEEAIRNEYQFVPRRIYDVERRHLLQSFLKQKRIYQSDYFIEKFEYQARKNIMRILQKNRINGAARR